MALGLILQLACAPRERATPAPPPPARAEALALAPSPDGRPHVVVLVLDDLGWGDLAALGHPRAETPNLDRLLAASRRWTFAHSPAAYCTPSRAGLLTGRHPNRAGAYHWGHALRPGTPTVAHAFGDAGYATLLAGKWHLGSVARDGFAHPGTAGFRAWSATLNFHDDDPWFSREGHFRQLRGEAAAVTVDEALRLWGQADPGPRFLWLALSAPHLPYAAAAADRAPFADLPGEQPAYLGELRAADRAIGRLLDALPADAIVALVSDNGGVAGLSRTGGRGEKGGLYEGGLRVPLAIRAPGLAPGPDARPVSGLDLAPTLRVLAGLEPGPSAEGRPLAGAGNPPSPERGQGFWAYPAPGIRTPSDPSMAALAASGAPCFPFEDEMRAWSARRDFPQGRYPGHAAWLEGRWKLHRVEDGRGAVRWELYDLTTDSLESRDLHRERAARRERMGEALEAWLADVLADMRSPEGR